MNITIDNDEFCLDDEDYENITDNKSTIFYRSGKLNISRPGELYGKPLHRYIANDEIVKLANKFKISTSDIVVRHIRDKWDFRKSNLEVLLRYDFTEMYLNLNKYKSNGKGKLSREKWIQLKQKKHKDSMMNE